MKKPNLRESAKMSIKTRCVSESNISYYPVVATDFKNWKTKIYPNLNTKGVLEFKAYWESLNAFEQELLWSLV